jgi:hypothetical protein
MKMSQKIWKATNKMNEFEAWQKIIEKWKEVDRMKILNQRLYDELGGSLMYILEYAERNNIILPNKDRLWRMVDNIHETIDIVKNHHDKINRYRFSTNLKSTTDLDT